MELWVRSQDRLKLVKADYISIDEVMNTTYKYGDIGKPSEYAIRSISTLGFYKTKERALKVLDEIHNLLIITEKGQSILIYEMPKE
jgi:hypothetical protein